MPSRYALALILAGATLASAEPSAVPAGAPAAELRLDTVLEIARDRAPAIAAARARIDAAQARGLDLVRLPDPSFAATAGRGAPRGGGDSRSEWSIEFAQRFPAPWGQRARRAAAEASTASAVAQREIVEIEVLTQAKLLYFEAVLGGARARALQQAADDARSLSELVARRVEVGESPGSDRLRTDLEALKTSSDARSATAIVQGLKSALDRFLLGALGPTFTLPDQVELPQAIAASPERFDTVVRTRPEVRVAELEVEAARAQIRVQSAARIPGFDVSVQELAELDRSATAVGFGVVIPIWNRNRSGIRLARAELAEAEANAIRVRSETETQFERLRSRDRAASERASTYQTQILPAASEALSVVRNSLEQGEASLLEWLDARRTYLEVVDATYAAALDALATRAQLERLAGEINANE